MKNVPTNLNTLKSKVDKLDADKLIPVPLDLSKLSDAVKNDVVKKDVYKVKIKNIEDKIPDITNLAIKASLNAAENKIPNISNLVKKKWLNRKIITEIENKITNHDHDKYITTPEFNRTVSENFTARLRVSIRKFYSKIKTGKFSK